MSLVFRSLAVRNYRLFAGGQAVSLTGTWMQRTAQDWLVLELSDDSGTALGIVLALQFGPFLLLSLYGGVLADRYDKRGTLVALQTVMGGLALVLGALVLTGSVTLGLVYLLALLLGVASALEVPVRQSFAPEIVGPELLPNAVSLNSATFNVARIIGPAVAGLLIAAYDTGPVFVLNGLSYAAVVVGLLRMRTADLRRTPRQARAPGQVLEGLRYVRGRPDLLLALVLVAVIGTFGLNFQLTLGLMAKTEFARGAREFGLLTSALAVGSLAGALVSARRTRVRQRLLLGSAMAFGVLEVAAGLAPTFWTLAALLVPTGALVLTFTTAANATVQLGTAPEMRGRVMALYVLVFLGGTPLGAPAVGVLSEAYGPRAGLLAGGALSVVCTLLVAAVLVRAQRCGSSRTCAATGGRTCTCAAATRRRCDPGRTTRAARSPGPPSWSCQWRVTPRRAWAHRGSSPRRRRRRWWPG